MAFSLGFNKEQLEGKPPIPAGWYQAQLKGFKPKAANLKPGETEPSSFSLNAELEVVNHPEHTGRKFFVGMNSKMAFMWPDFVHAAGLQMEVIQDEHVGTEKENSTIPGVFENADTHPDDPSVWKYLGPLTNATMEVELASIPAQGGFKPKNEVRQFKCAVPGCTVKHATNLIKK